MDLEAVAEVRDVVQRAARGRAHERVDVGAEPDEPVREVRAHEAVRAGDEHGAAFVDVSELLPEIVERAGCPEGVVRHGAYASASVSKGTGSPGLGSVRSGALTAASMLLVSGVAALIGVVIASEFGRTDETDGFLAAYGVFVVIVIAAQAIRLTVLPQLARARLERRLAGELAGFAIALGVFALPLLARDRAGRGRAREAADGRRVRDRAGRLRGRAALHRPGGGRAPVRRARRERARGARRLRDRGARLHRRQRRGAHADPPPRRARRDHRRGLGHAPERDDRGRDPARGSRVSGHPHADAPDGDPTFGPASEGAARRLRRRLGSAARAAAPVRGLPPVRRPARDRRGDELRLRVSRGGLARDDHGRFARDRHVRATRSAGPGRRRDGAPRRRDRVAEPRRRRRRGRHVRARRRRHRRGRPRWRLRRRRRRRPRPRWSSR